MLGTNEKSTNDNQYVSPSTTTLNGGYDTTTSANKSVQGAYDSLKTKQSETAKSRYTSSLKPSSQQSNKIVNKDTDVNQSKTSVSVSSIVVPTEPSLAPTAEKVDQVTNLTNEHQSVNATKPTTGKTEAIVSVPTTSSPAAIDTKKQSFDAWSNLILPFLIILCVLNILYRLMVHSIRKNPPHGGFAHHHKHIRPGVPKPKLGRR